jgi:hypothetical protein
MMGTRTRAGCALVALLSTASSIARADETPVTAQVDLEKDEKPADLTAAAPEEAPPPVPYKKTVVVDTSLGALTFLGKFGDTAPTAPWFHTQLGYEVLSWLMFFAETDLAFTDTSGTEQPPKTRAFAIFGFGGGARFTVRITDSFGVYVQPSVGLMESDIAHRALAIIGYPDAESFNLYARARLGIEYYQRDRHFAIGLTSAIEEAQGYKRTGGSDTPLALDVGASLRYAF